MHQHNNESKSRGEVFLLEDEHCVRELLSAVLTGAGYEVVCFADSRALLTAARSRVPACILLHLFLPGKPGLDLLRELHAEHYPAPILVMSGRGTIALAVSAIKLGAVDFIEKPFRGPEMVARVTEAIESHVDRRAGGGTPSFGPPHLPGSAPLSEREREVLEEFISGASTKEVARALGISPRTVEDHRARIMRKFGARAVADLIRIAIMGARNLSS